jgi:hypothetical protein
LNELKRQNTLQGLQEGANQSTSQAAVAQVASTKKEVRFP